MNNIDKLIELNEKKTELLKECRESLKYEKCLYHVVNQPDRIGRFFLVDIKTGQIVRDGSPDKLKAWLRLRKIDESKVYHFNLIN